MCLKSRFETKEEVDRHIPADEFFCYKIVAVSGDTLVSPHYEHHKWHQGENVSDGVNRGNGDVGIYVFLAPLGVKLTKTANGWTHGHGGNRIVRMRCRREDVVWAGVDRWDNNEGICFVMRKVEVSEEDYKNALDPNFMEAEVKQLLVKTEKTIKKSRSRVGKVIDKAKKLGKKVMEKVTKKKTATKKKATKAAEKAKKKVAKKKPASKYDKYSTPELRIAAKAKKIKGYTKMTRAKLIEALRK